MTDDGIAAAELRATEARQRLNSTVGELQAGLEPRKLARNALAEVSDGGERAARAGMAAARRNPALAAGSAALLVAFLARKRIAGILSKARRRDTTFP